MTATTQGAPSAKERLARRLEEKRQEQSSSERGSTASSPSGPATTTPPNNSGTTPTDLGRSSHTSKTAPSKQAPDPTTGGTEIPSSPVTETARIVVSLMSDNSLVFGGENINKIGVGVIQNIARRLPRHVMEYARKELIRVRTEQRAAERQQQG